MKGKPQPPFGLDMGFDDALARFIGTDPEELAESVASAKEKRKPPKRPPPKEEHEKSLD